MSLLRHSKIRRSVSAAVLLFSLFAQLQTVFACDLMEDQVSTTCCCEVQMEKGCASGGGCEGKGSNPAADCCQTSLSATSIDVVADAPYEAILNSSHPVETTALIAPLSTRLDPFPATTVLIVEPDHGAHWQTGTGTYLATLRIRI